MNTKKILSTAILWSMLVVWATNASFGNGFGGWMKFLTDEEKIQIESMTQEEKQEFMLKKREEQEVIRTSHESVIDKLLNRETLTDDEENLVEEIKTMRAERQVQREKMQENREAFREVMEAKRNGETLTEEQEALIEEFSSFGKGQWNHGKGKWRGQGRWFWNLKNSTESTDS